MSNTRYVNAELLNNTDKDKATKIAQSIIDNGWVGRKILILDMGGNQYRALTGNHRLAALQALNEKEEYKLIDSLDCFEIITSDDIDEVYSYETSYGYTYDDCLDDDSLYRFLADMAENTAINDSIKTYLDYIDAEIDCNNR